MNADQSPLYSSLADDEDIGEIVALYAGEMPDRTAALQQELDAKKWADLQILVHQLKGSAGSHGFAPVSRIAAQLNELLQDEPLDEEKIVDIAQQLIDLCRRVCVSKGAS